MTTDKSMCADIPHAARIPSRPSNLAQTGPHVFQGVTCRTVRSTRHPMGKFARDGRLGGAALLGLGYLELVAGGLSVLSREYRVWASLLWVAALYLGLALAAALAVGLWDWLRGQPAHSARAHRIAALG